MALLMYWSTMQVYTSPTSGAVLPQRLASDCRYQFWGMSTQFRRYFLIERGTGTIVNLSSIGAKCLPYPYSASKFAVTGLTEALHSELKPKGIHVCGIYPSVIKSSLMERAIFRARMTRTLKPVEISSTRYLSTPVVEKPEDVAQAIWDAVKISGLRLVGRELVEGSLSIVSWLDAVGFQAGLSSRAEAINKLVPKHLIRRGCWERTPNC